MADMQDGKFAHDATAAPQSSRVLPLFSLKGKTAIVAGASSGIGLAVAQALAEAGANVAIWYNTRKDQAEQAAAAIEKDYGVKCMPTSFASPSPSQKEEQLTHHQKTGQAYQVDITSYDTVASAIDSQLPAFNSRLDIFIANSGKVWTAGAMLDGPVSMYDAVVRTNLDGTYFCARAAGQHFRRQKQENTLTNPPFTSGSFVATASMSGHVVNVPQLQAAYNASKAGVVHLCKSLAVEWVGFGRANSVSPGYINTSISEFCPEETRRTWKDKIPMG